MNYQNYQNIPQFQNQFSNMQYNQPYQQPMQGMYMDRLTQLQSQQGMQMQNVQQPFMPLGKIVESIDIVKATDIPMDGNMYYFPKADGTEVYMKRWLPNGTTETVAYRPLLQEQVEQRNEGATIDITNLIQYLNDIQNEIKMLNDKVDKFSRPNNSKGRRESQDNEQ